MSSILNREKEYKGVYYCNTRKKFRVKFSHNRKVLLDTYGDDPKKLAIMRDKVIIRLNLNEELSVLKKI